MYIETIDDIISKTLDKIFIKWIMGNQDDVLLNTNRYPTTHSYNIP